MYMIFTRHTTRPYRLLKMKKNGLQNTRGEDLFYCFSPAAKRRPGNPSARSEPKEKRSQPFFFLSYPSSDRLFRPPSLWMGRSRRSNKESTWASLFLSFFFLSISRLLLTDVFPNCLLLTLRIVSRSVASHLRSLIPSEDNNFFGFYFILKYRFAIGEIPPPRSRKRKTR